MKNNYKNSYLEFVVVAVIGALSILVLDLFPLWMPNMVHMTMLLLLLAAFATYALFVLREQATDERELFHRMFSARIGFLLGAGAIIVGIAYQSLSHAVDPWLVITLFFMIGGKIAARFYSDKEL